MPTIGLALTLIWNYARHRAGKSTICSFTRRYVPVPVFVLGMAWFNAWFIPHWLKPKLRARRAQSTIKNQREGSLD